ncbi:hypothetical protein BBJ28_00001555 [Nothophytophthora sp. Chile5]|nr:hypothetical protein BBJ28_00001555 [Nothophytophthora sp. Chile5]
MLPNLSDSTGKRLQLMVPVAVVPEWLSARRRSLLQLKKITALRVSGRTGRGSKARYTIEVFIDSPTNCGSGVAAPSSSSPTDEASSPIDFRSRKPTYQTDRSLEKFGDLRSAIYDAAWSAHSAESCLFCAEMVQFFVFGSMDPEALTLRLLGEDRALRKLTKFACDVLELTVRHAAVDSRGVCAGQAHIPQLVHDFFFNPVPVGNEAA